MENWLLKNKEKKISQKNTYQLDVHITRSTETHLGVASFNPILNNVGYCSLFFSSSATAKITARLASPAIQRAFPKAPQHYLRHRRYGNRIRKQFP
ncbi:hypothetical protein GDO81_002500 [Engystomops pustulosus]|uniref:Uncharacterized protein n=1 Tax=Engystomops pustulosus TaxID=76066 RepID=A0AAV7DNB3_ENGPU|nr:hypothetical protein GDO81_002500 [Engystomops pustulosus]